MHKEDDFACDAFVAQKWRKDVCKNCYQPLKLHDKKQRRTSVGKGDAPAAKRSPNSSPPDQPKVFQRFLVNRDATIDRSVPARERTQQPAKIEGVPSGIIQRVIADTAHTRVGLELPPRRGAGVLPSRPAPPPGSARLPPRPTPPPTAASKVAVATAAPQEETSSVTAEQQSKEEEKEALKSETVPIVTGDTIKEDVSIVDAEKTETVSVDLPNVDQTPPQGEATVEPPQVEATVEPPPQVGATVELPPQVEATVEPPPQVGATVEPPPQVGATVELPQVEATVEPPPQVEATVEPPPQVEATVELPPQVEATVEPPQVEATVEPPPQVGATVELPQVEATVEPPPQVEATVEPPPQVEATVEPPPQVEATVEPPQVEATVEPPQVEATVELPPQVEATVELPPQVEATVELPQVEATVEPPPQVEATVEPPPQVEATVELPPQVEATVEPPQVEATVEPPQVEATVELSPQVEATVEPPPQVEATVEPPPQVEATVEPPPQVEATVELPQVEATVEPPPQVEATVEPPPQVEATVELPQVEATVELSPQVEATVELPQVEATVEPPPQVEATVEPPQVEATFEASVENLPDEVKSKPAAVASAQENGSSDIPAPPPPPSLDAPPPPPPPPISTPSPATQRKATIHKTKKQHEVGAHENAMSAIKRGVSLRSTPAPVPRPSPGEDKVVDVASELRQRMLRQKKKEVASVSSQLEQHREAIRRLTEQLQTCRGSPSFLGQLTALLNQVDALLSTINVPLEILVQKLSWPSRLVDDLREVMSHMKVLEDRVAAVEDLCRNTIQQSSEVVSPPAVERCVRDVVRVAKELNQDESRFSAAAQSFPVDDTDVRYLLQRASDAVAPLLDRMYDKALQTHLSVFDASVSKYDLGFRLQNAQRLLQLCCGMSDTLAMHLELPKHPQYSDAQLKSVELQSDFKQATSVIDRQGQWDAEEQVQLQSTFSKRAAVEGRGKDELVGRVLEAVGAGRVVRGGGEEAVLEEVSAELFGRIQLQLIKAALSCGSTEVVDCVLALRDRHCTDDTAKHRRDYDWLLEAVNKSNCDCLTHLVKQHGMSLHTQSGEQANSVLHRAAQRQDIATVRCLINLGASPVVKNLTKRTAMQLLALKCFPPQHLTAEADVKELLFDLTGYINSPSLSDVVLVAADGVKFSGHRLVLCAQSPVLKNMLDSDLWQESHNKEIPLPTISSRVVQLLLQYLYTGRCLFPRDDLNLGIELLAAADQLLLAPMKAQCEHTLSEKIDAEVAVPLYHAAFGYSARKLLANCCNFLLNNYEEITDPGHEALLHLLENAAEITAMQM